MALLMTERKLPIEERTEPLSAGREGVGEELLRDWRAFGVIP